MQKTLLALILPLLLVGCKQNVSEQEISSEDRLVISKYEMSDTGKDKLNQNAEDLAEKEFCESQWVKDTFKSNSEYGKTRCLLLSPEKNIAVVAVEKFNNYKDKEDGEFYEYLDVDIYLVDYKKKQVLDHYYDKKSVIANIDEVGIRDIQKIKNFESAFILDIGQWNTGRYPSYSDVKADIYMYTPSLKIKKLSHNLRSVTSIEQYNKNYLPKKCIGAGHDLTSSIQALTSTTNGLPDIQVVYTEKAKEFVEVKNKKSVEDDDCQWQTAVNYPNDIIVLKFDGKQYPLPAQDKYNFNEYYGNKFYENYAAKYNMV